uniref:intermembrane lipid transfer protein VPS13A-like n=1 Tax=Myxine glutinosa TaxID=7769 RepID=UPI00358E910B
MLGAEERTKLYTAIGYSASTAADPTLPHEYVAHIVQFHLMSASFAMHNGPHQPPLLKIQLLGFLATLSQRPSAGAIKLETRLDHVHIIGKGQADGVPHLLTSQTLTSPASNTAQTPASTALLHFAFETNPLDRKADQRLTVAAQPLELVYDAQTMLAMVEFFHVPNPPQLDQLAATTVSKLQDMKEMTTAGVQHMIQTQRVLDLSIELKASYLLIPSGGFFQKNCSLLILDFGNLQMSSADRGALLTPGSPSLSPEELMEHVYERFHLHLSHLQLLYCNAEVDWKSCRTLPTSPYHVLEPLALHFGLARCLTSLDPLLPKFTILGELPLLKVRVMDTVLKSMYDLMASIPLPSLTDSSAGDKTAPQEHGNVVPGVTFIPAQNNLQAFTAAFAASPIESDSEFQSAEESFTESGSCDDEFADPAESVEVSKSASRGSAENSPQNQKQSENGAIKQNVTDLRLKFEVTKVLLELCRQEQDQQVSVLRLDVQQLGGEVTVHTWHLKAIAYLHTLAVHSFEFKDDNEEPLSLVQSGGTDSRLLSAEYIKVNQDNPEFETTFNSREQFVKVCFSSLDLMLHLEALLRVWSFLSPLLVHTARPSDQQLVEVDSTDLVKTSVIMPIKIGSKKQLHSFVDFEIEANMEAFSVCICDQEHVISNIYIKGLEASVLKQSKQTVLNTSLKDILVLDSDPNTIHNKVVCITGKEVFNLRLCLYDEEFDGVGDLETEDVRIHAGAGKIDGRVELHVGCIKVIHSAQFFSALLAFSDNFQTAKGALSAATAQAAERAAEGVKVLAQRSSQYVLLVNLKAPVIIFPADQRAIVADLGLITITNQFTTHSVESMTAFPALGNNGVLEDLPIIDNINIHLADLKVYRVNMLNGSSTQGQSDIVDEGTGSEVVLLEPVTLDVLVKRNLSSAWFQDCPDVAVKSQLRAIKIFLSQDDLRLSLKAMWESLGNKKQAAPPSRDKTEQLQKKVAFPSSAEPSLASSSSQHVNFMLECELPSLQLALLQVAEAERSRDEEYRLGEVYLSGMSASIKMDTNDKIQACVTLKSFTLEDQRPEITRISSRVVTLESTQENGVAADICWTRESDGDILESTFQRIYVCVSLDFLISVSHFFLDDPAADVSSDESLKEFEPEKQHHIVQKNLKAEGTKSSPGTQSITVIVHVKSPELVFVADMSRADAPAIVATMECHGTLRSMPEEFSSFLVIRGLRLTAMAFLEECREDNTATVLHPCDLYIKSSQAGDKPPFINFVCASINLRVRCLHFFFLSRLHVDTTGFELVRR